jgi:hypothetical protein
MERWTGSRVLSSIVVMSAALVAACTADAPTEPRSGRTSKIVACPEPTCDNDQDCGDGNECALVEMNGNDDDRCVTKQCRPPAENGCVEDGQEGDDREPPRPNDEPNGDDRDQGPMALDGEQEGGGDDDARD